MAEVATDSIEQSIDYWITLLIISLRQRQSNGRRSRPGRASEPFWRGRPLCQSARPGGHL